MRNKMILVVIFLILSPGSLVTQETKSNSDLEIAKALIVTDPSGDGRDDLRVLIYVRNTGRKTITVLTRNLQHEIFLYEDRPIELHITLSTSPTINGSSVILSLPFLAPVELHPGEVAEIALVDLIVHIAGVAGRLPRQRDLSARGRGQGQTRSRDAVYVRLKARA